jgi:hypothetical protein
MTAQASVTSEQIQAKWDEMSPLIDKMMERVGTPGEFPVSPKSNLADDDSASDPYQVSHVIRHCLTAGVDHLHAVKTLVRESGLLHVAAPATVSRGALETLATAYWILDPASRGVRIERSLRWHAKNIKDGDTARVEAGLTGGKSREDRLKKVQAVADARGITAKVTNGYTSTEALQWADDNPGKPRMGLLFPWRLCSGFAHGRPWAYLGTSVVEVQDTAEPGIKNAKLENNESLTLLAPLAAMFLLEDLLRTYQRRASASLLF